VFGSDASTSGFAYGMESCPVQASSRLPLHMRPGVVRMGVWSAAAGDAARQQSSASIQYGEAFCVLAAAVEFGPVMRGSHVVFVLDNDADVWALNRQSTRDPAVAAVLRAVCDMALRHNFSFSAVHRYGVDNDLMDWASRPERHLFARSPSAYTPPPAHTLTHSARALLSITRFPPLRYAAAFVLVNSRCVQFETKHNSATWCGTSNGWR
jgi:hypothetical protein